MKWESLSFVAILAALAGGAYYLFRSGGPLGAGAPDPGGGAPATSAFEAIYNQFEIGKSSLSMGGAAQSFFSDPLGAMESILGYSPSSGTDTSSDGADYSGVTG